MSGTEFNLSYKNALILALMFITLTYFGPIPILLPICSLYFLIQYWVDKTFFVRFCKIPPYFSQTMHLTLMRTIPFALMFHCLFSMWAYGSPEVWPDGFHASGTNTLGQTVYQPNDRDLHERLFGENSIAFFALFIIFIVLYIFENVVVGIVSKYVFKIEKAVNTNQKPYSEVKDEISDWTLNSYDPAINLKYNKLLRAMLDVAEDNNAPQTPNTPHKKDYTEQISHKSDSPIHKEALPDINELKDDPRGVNFSHISGQNSKEDMPSDPQLENQEE